MQCDSEKADKITGGACACACNDDKVIFENPLNWTTRSFIFAKQREYENGLPLRSQWRNYRARPRPRKTQRGGALCPGPKLPARLIRDDKELGVLRRSFVFCAA